MNRSIAKLILGGFIAIAVLTTAALGHVNWSWTAFWFTPEQQGDRLMRRSAFNEAAGHYRDAMHIGTALYRAGEFKGALNAFTQVQTPEGHFNRGNTLMMLGYYGDAGEAFEAALSERPNWQAAADNKELARLRLEWLKKMAEDMVGKGNQPPDDIEIDFTKTNEENQPQPQMETAEKKRELSDAELQALWLRRIQTRPADFLRAKFAYQSQMKEPAPKTD